MKEKIFDWLSKEEERQENTIDLICSENYVSKDVLKACGHCIQNKYSEGYIPDKNGFYRRYYAGCEYVDKIESATCDLICKAFGTEYANVQPHSGTTANIAVYTLACNYFNCKPEDLTIISHSLNSGSHLTHGSKASISGKWFKTIQFETDDNGFFNYNEIEKILNSLNDNAPAVLVVGMSSYPRQIDYERLAKIVDNAHKDIIVLVDSSHISGLIITKHHQNPFDYYWGTGKLILTSTSHKTLRGPRHAFITTNDIELGKLLDKAVFPNNLGGPLQNMIAALGIAMCEALTLEFNNYIERLLCNIKAMEKVFNDKNIDMVTGGSDNHLILLDLSKHSMSGKDLEYLLEKIGIIANKNAVKNDNRPKTITSGLRIGTSCITTRNFNEKECARIAEIIADIILYADDRAAYAAKTVIDNGLDNGQKGTVLPQYHMQTIKDAMLENYALEYKDEIKKLVELHPIYK